MVGIVGGGQLARMTAQAAIALGIHVRVLAERADDAAALVVADVELGDPDSLNALTAFAAGCDVVTLDHELVNIEALAALEAAGRIVRPGPAALRFAQDKLYQRATFAAAGLPVPAFADVPDAAAIEAFAAQSGWPVVVKAQRGGYDGRGVWVVTDAQGAADLVREAGTRGVALMVETYVAIDRELAVLVARRPGGQCVVYPVVETVQRDGICHEVIAPAPVPAAIAERAAALGVRIAEVTGAVGVIATELFLVGDALLINEVATRPHNSGHVSIDGCLTSQFENHLRAVLDWPLGPTGLLAPVAVMANVLGADSEDIAPRIPAALDAGARGVQLHLYGKAARPGRKVGHVNALGDELAETRARALRAAAVLSGRTT